MWQKEGPGIYRVNGLGIGPKKSDEIMAAAAKRLEEFEQKEKAKNGVA
nr:hypothetical protein [uncultured Allobacillus sp.]